MDRRGPDPDRRVDELGPDPFGVEVEQTQPGIVRAGRPVGDGLTVGVHHQPTQGEPTPERLPVDVDRLVLAVVVDDAAGHPLGEGGGQRRREQVGGLDEVRVTRVGPDLLHPAFVARTRAGQPAGPVPESSWSIAASAASMVS